ncbi:phospholipase sgr2, partial [Quercus suber]
VYTEDVLWVWSHRNLVMINERIIRGFLCIHMYTYATVARDLLIIVSIQLNRLYLKFLKRNPGYDGKVSIYGHSLGSVLSYDILCHQENLSSPFPMDWMYKDQARNKESSPDVNNQSSLCDSLTKLEDKDFMVVNETEDRVDHFEDKITSQTDLDAENEEGDAEDSSIIVGPITSDLDELTAKAMDSKQPGGEKDVDTFFAVGSPLGVFLALRNIRLGIDTCSRFNDLLFVFIPGKGKEYWEEENISEEMPACRQMFNIFHPFDPVAYRSVIVPLLR